MQIISEYKGRRSKTANNLYYEIYSIIETLHGYFEVTGELNGYRYRLKTDYLGNDLLERVFKYGRSLDLWSMH